jgi:hypothetical protein
MDCPIPRVPPVTRAVCPEREKSSWTVVIVVAIVVFWFRMSLYRRDNFKVVVAIQRLQDYELSSSVFVERAIGTLCLPT